MTRHPIRLLAGAALLALLAYPLARGEEPAPAPDDGAVVDSSYDAPDGTRVLRQSIVVPATLEQVWKIWTTAEGWKSFAVPFAVVDFRVGGMIETSYDAQAKPGLPTNIRNRILAYLPLHMIALQAEQAPPNFPAPELLPELFAVMQFDTLEGERVRITVSGIGYREGERYDLVYRMFEQGNAWTLRKLRQMMLAARAER